VTSAELFAAAAVRDGFYAVSIPFFGAERRGAHVVAFNRISDTRVYVRSSIKNPDFVVVLDSKLLGLEHDKKRIFSGLKKESVLVVNADKEVAESLGWRNVACVNATEIALKNRLVLAGIPLTNTAMLGALAKVFGEISLKSFEEAVKAKWSGRRAEVNLMALREGYSGVRWI